MGTNAWELEMWLMERRSRDTGEMGLGTCMASKAAKVPSLVANLRYVGMIETLNMQTRAVLQPVDHHGTSAPSVRGIHSRNNSHAAETGGSGLQST